MGPLAEELLAVQLTLTPRRGRDWERAIKYDFATTTVNMSFGGLPGASEV